MTIVAETVNAAKPQTVHISLPDVVKVGQKLNVFVTCLNESCTGFPNKLHSMVLPRGPKSACQPGVLTTRHIKQRISASNCTLICVSVWYKIQKSNIAI